MGVPLHVADVFNVFLARRALECGSMKTRDFAVLA